MPSKRRSGAEGAGCNKQRKHLIFRASNDENEKRLTERLRAPPPVSKPCLRARPPRKDCCRRHGRVLGQGGRRKAPHSSASTSAFPAALLQKLCCGRQVTVAD